MLIQTKTLPSPVRLEDRLLHDRRCSPRIPAQTSAWLWRIEDPEDPQEPLAIQILDYSDRGVGFISTLPLDVSERVDLDLEGDGLRRTRVRVTQCEFHNGTLFRVGALYEGKLPT
jgi:hypothetical protein